MFEPMLNMTPGLLEMKKNEIQASSPILLLNHITWKRKKKIFYLDLVFKISIIL